MKANFYFSCGILLLVLDLTCTSTLNNSTRTADFVVQTKAGKIRGAERPNGGAEFLGIPYAQPPIGDLRWHEPVPMQPWSDVRQATKFGAPCSQPVLGDWNRRDSESSNEDCLFLNVITPAWPATGRLPVMFWIHGGANAGGTASSPLYKDGTLISHGVILVTVNYRLNIFGFLSHPELTRESSHHASGNYALMDQIAGLRWVHDNIAKFGGDPNNVTVFGQSAGAQDTGLLMASPLTEGLFHRAILQSGSGINPPCAPLADSEKAGQTIAASLKAPAGDGAVKYLRGLSSEELLKTVANLNPTQPLLLSPNVDGYVIKESPDRVFSEQQQMPIPMLVGTTTREFPFPSAIPDLRKFIENVTGPVSSRALQAYGLAGDAQGNSDALYGSAGDQWFADLLFRCPVTTQAMWHSTLNKSTYQYELAHAIPGQEAQGAVHSADLPYVFGYFPKTGNISGSFGDVDYKLAKLIGTYWTNFAKKGNPNSDSVQKWPEFGTSQSYLRFTQSGEVTVLSKLRQPQCDVMREVYKRRMNP